MNVRAARASWAPRRPQRPWVAALLLVVGVVSVNRPRAGSRSPEQRWRDRLHHDVLPAMDAAQRAIDHQDPERATEQLRVATTAARTLLVDPPPGADPVGTAIARAHRTWGSSVSVDAARIDSVPHRTSTQVLRALYTITLEGLHNVGHHQPGACTTVVLRAQHTELLLTLASRGGQQPSNSPDPTTREWSGSGHGLKAMHRAANTAGGHVDIDLTPGSALIVARLPVRRPRMPHALQPVRR